MILYSGLAAIEWCILTGVILRLFQKLTKVRVVGVTCAASEFPCLDKFNFSVSCEITLCKNVENEMNELLF